jgi:dephospho-CoA kinase
MSESITADGQLRIGLTGGIGAGKSTVAALLAEKGAAIVDADAVAREVVEPGEPALQALVREFGPQVVDDDGALDRQALAAAAFVSAERTAALNAIMHPAIAARTQERFAALAASPVVVHDVPLLVEKRMGAAYHLCVLVDVPAPLRLDRLVRSRGLDREDAQRRIAQQADDAQRYEECDAVLDNAGEPAALRRAFDALWTERIEPFALALDSGRAQPAAEGPEGEPTTEAEAAVRAHAPARLRRRLEHCLAAAGAGAETLSAVTAEPLGFRLETEGLGGAEAVEGALRGGGWLAADRGLRVFADPVQPGRLHLR